MSLPPAEERIQNVVSVGAAYQPARDTRETLSALYALGLAAGSIACAIWSTIDQRWDVGGLELTVSAAAAALIAALIPWNRLPKSALLSLYLMTLGGILAASYIFELPTLMVLLLIPMMSVTCFFWDNRWLVAFFLAVAAFVFIIPVLTGDAFDRSAALIVTLPAMLVVACLSGSLAARVLSMRTSQRARYKATIEALSAALTARDGYTGEHSQETLDLVLAICGELKLSSSTKEYIADVALLHDIGKIGIPNEILHKPGKLDAEQWEIMKQHPVIGEQIVVKIPGLEEVARAIRHEHERWDGNGYPDGLKAGAIPLASRIVLVCDAFHAMTSDRPYRRAMSVDAAKIELSRNAGTQFDPKIVKALLHVLDRPPQVFVPAANTGF
jgi:HD-GYP domain-containing protein (c-di-GMP phosphodiesterase class II)